MTDRIQPPNLSEGEILLNELLKEVHKWESTLSEGVKIGPGSEALNNLLQTKLSFGNPNDNLVRLTKKRFKEIGVELNGINKLQVNHHYDFYYMTMVVNMRPRPGAQFRTLCCELQFGPKGLSEPIVQAIFPKNEWRPVINWGGELKLGLDGRLDWLFGVDTSKISDIHDIPAELKTQVVNENQLKSFITLPDFNYEVGRFDIVAYGDGSSECYWYIQDPDVQKLSSVQFALVFKVPKGVESITLSGVAWAEPNINWLTANLRNVIPNLKLKFRNLFSNKDKASKTFARGISAEWELPLPRKTPLLN